jgi:hypothetical protein
LLTLQERLACATAAASCSRCLVEVVLGVRLADVLGAGAHIQLQAFHKCCCQRWQHLGIIQLLDLNLQREQPDVIPKPFRISKPAEV